MVRAKLRSGSPALSRPGLIVIKQSLRRLLVPLLLTVAAGAFAASPTLDRIKATGKVTFGYREAAPPFSVKQRDGRIRGYSVELCEKVVPAIAKALDLANLKVEWRPVDSETRISDVVDS